MKTIIAAVILVAAISAGAQTQTQNLPAESNLTIGTIPGPPSLAKCGKYEHADPAQWACGQPCASDSTSCVATWGCAWTTPKCVDDVHVVTEKEWQALLSLAAEKPRNVDSANETHVLPTCKGQECADAEHSCKPGFIYDKDFELCARHFVDHAGNSCWTGQDNSGGGCSTKQPPFKDSDGNVGNTLKLATPTPGTKLEPDGSLADAGGVTMATIAPLTVTADAPNTVILATAGSVERIELPTTGDVILVAYNKEDKRTLTVYRDGHILAEGADPDEITKRFWRLFADAERAAFPACRK
jgi:hypothetical protein